MHSLFQKAKSDNDAHSKTAADANSIHGIVASMLSRADNGIVTIAPGIAKRILEETNFEGQRTLKPIRRQKHLNRLIAGTWNPNFPVTFAMLPDGRLYLVDGQHRMDAIVAFDVATRVRINISAVKVEDDIRKLYAGFDESDSSRSEIEVIDGVGLVQSAGIRREVVRGGMRALAVIINNMEPSQGSGAAWEARMLDSRLSAFPDWEEEISAWARITELANRFIKNKLLNAGCMAVGIYTLKHQPGRAMEFWSALAENDGLGKNDPRARLIADFQTRSLRSGSSRQVIQAPAVAWNAWNEGRDLKIIKCVDGAAITIWGTPYAKGNR
jgi:hypothetical protein